MTICRTGKKDWPTQEEAEARLEEIREEAKRYHRPDPKIPNRVYRCEFCQQYHMTHQDKRNRWSMT